MNMTATTHGAREHARKQVGKAAETMQTIPASAASDLPTGVRADQVVWDETVPLGGYAARELKRGTRLRLTNLQGDACAQFLCFNAQRPIERLNVADTVKVQWNAYPTEGSVLLSDMGRALLSIRRDTSGRHDTFCGASTRWSNARKYGETHGVNLLRNARDNFLVALLKYGLDKRDIPASINFFKGVKIDDEGNVNFIGAQAQAGEHLELKAEMDVLVVLANCPHVMDPREEYRGTPMRLTAWREAITPQDDSFRTSTPEVERAFLNVDDYYLG